VGVVVLYSDCRDKIKSGDVILWDRPGFTASMVKKATEGRWSHIGVAAWWNKRLMVFESCPYVGTVVRPMRHVLDYATWMQSNVTWNEEAFNYAVCRLDRPYGMANVLWTGLWLYWGKSLLRRNPIFKMPQYKTEYQCAQYVVEILAKTGLELNLNSPATPENIAQKVNRPPAKAGGLG
jgi:hypothetical protein